MASCKSDEPEIRNEIGVNEGQEYDDQRIHFTDTGLVQITPPTDNNGALLNSSSASAGPESGLFLPAQAAPNRTSNNASGMTMIGCSNINQYCRVTNVFQEATFNVNPDSGRIWQPNYSAMLLEKLKYLLCQTTVKVRTPTAQGSCSIMLPYTWICLQQFEALKKLKTGRKPFLAPLIVKTRKDIIATDQDASNAVVEFLFHTKTHRYIATKCRKHCTEIGECTFLKCHDIPKPIRKHLKRVARGLCELIKTILCGGSALLRTLLVVGHRGSDLKIVCEDQHRGETPPLESTFYGLDDDADRFFSSNSGQKFHTNNWTEVKNNVFTGDKSPLLIHFGPGIETCINSIQQSL